MDQSAAFARARGFLNYHRVAKWSALAAAIGTAVFYVVLLMLLGLYADLIVNRGEIPSFRRLSDGDQAAFKKEWKEPEELLNHFPPQTIDATIAERDLPREEALALKSSLTKAKAHWRTRVKELAVHYENDDSTLQSILQMRLALHDLGIKGDKLDEWTEHCLDPATMRNDYERELRWELLWRIHIYQLLSDRAGEDAGKYMARSFKETAEKSNIYSALNRSIPDMGILHLVFRTQNRFDNRVIAQVARFVPWLYDSGVVKYLVVLLVLAVVVGIIRALCSFAGQYFAAQAVIGA